MAKILLVEDDKSLREIYGVRLLAEGYDIVSAGDGEEALAMAIKDRPDLIVSDVMMPKISGFDMLDILRSTTETRDIKVIMMTALSSEDQRQRGEQLGADRYLVKSQVGIEDVVRTVHEVLADTPNTAPAANAFAAPAPSAVPTAEPESTPEPTAERQMPVMTRPLSTAAPEPSSSPEPSAPSTPSPQPPVPVVPAAAPAPLTTTPPQAQTTDPQVQQPTPPSPMPTDEPSADPQQDTPVPSSLPQPTAPFSTSRPATLGERVIQPLEKPEDTGPHIADLIDQELKDSTSIGSANSTLGQPVPTTPISPPETVPPQQPIPPVSPPAPSAPVMDTAALNYEETPTPAAPLPQQQPQAPSAQPPQPPAAL